MGGDIADVQGDSQTVQAIFAHYKQQGDNGYMSRTVPASMLGHPCERYLWYCYRQCCKPDFDGRMYRLFETGQREEERIAADLRAIGCTVHVEDEQTKRQFLVTEFGGHLKGYLDGCVLGLPEAPKTWHVLEMKTHNAKSFRDLCRQGVRKSQPKHAAQCAIYMHLTGMKRALYFATCKDNDAIYIERLRYDKSEAKVLMAKAQGVIESVTPPFRLSDRPDYYECRWCDAHDICHGTGEFALPVPKLSCRHCCHATPVVTGDGGQWECERHHVRINTDSPCSDHLTLPVLLPFAEPGIYDEDERERESIEFRNADGTTWKHGNASGCITSHALMGMPASLTGNETVSAAGDLFGARITGYVADDILARYPEGDSRVIWKGRAGEFMDAWNGIYQEKFAELKPIARCDLAEATVCEYEGGRIAILWEGGKLAEIREGVE